MKKKYHGYVRVSTDGQDRIKQEHELLLFAQKEEIVFSEIISETISSRAKLDGRLLSGLLEAVRPGDYIVTPELSRLGRSISQILRIVDDLIKKNVGIVLLKENIRICADGGGMDMSTKIQISMFSLFAEIERDLVSIRTKEGLKAAKAKGVKLGRQKGQQVRCRLDNYQDFITESFSYGIPASHIIRRLKSEKNVIISRAAFDSYVKSRKLKPSQKKNGTSLEN